MTSAPGNTTAIATHWYLYRTTPGAATCPKSLDRRDSWDNALVPGTVASTVFDSDIDLFHPPFDIDDFDWWYETDIGIESLTAGILVFEGLATVAEVWLNGHPIHRSQNMYRSYRVDIAEHIESTNKLTIAFRSLNHFLQDRRPRPRWKTRLVNTQQLRWIRTTLLGRIPGWTPPVHAVGPWRPILLETEKQFDITSVNLVATRPDGIAELKVDLAMSWFDDTQLPESAVLRVCGREHELHLQIRESTVHISGMTQLGDAAPWWPHTHGTPVLHSCEILVRHGQHSLLVHGSNIGFRNLNINRDNDKVELQLNGQAVFARGGCWTVNDFLSLSGNADELRRKLTLIRDAGANMIRVGGTMVYESDLFYSLCDELGILVWQDLMLANMDYPTHDGKFANDLLTEIEAQLGRIGAHPSTAVFCGNSEVEQQAAMFGMTEETWASRFYYETIPALIDESKCGVPYFASSPVGGALPFHNAHGVAHYFGIGAYKQPFSDLTKVKVKFASECLAFSNVPDDPAMKKHFGNPSPATHAPTWKTGVPRDASAGWDFEDIRDHYISELYGVNPIALRYADNSRYLAISQLVTGEIMEHVFNRWRSDQDPCGGGLIWWLNDIVPGAGWGMLDSDGNPKPLYYFLRRCWGQIALSIDERSLDGLFIRTTNETHESIEGKLHVKVLQHAGHCIAEASVAISVAATSTDYTSVDKMLGRFFDTTYSYRFGPPKHDVVVATFDTGQQQNPLTATYYPGHRDLRLASTEQLSIETRKEDNQVTICLRSNCFLKGVKLTSAFYAFDDNYFDLPPGTDWRVIARPLASPAKPFRATLSALNLEHPMPIS